MIGGFLTGRAGGSSIFICSILLAIATILMAKSSESEKKTDFNKHLTMFAKSVFFFFCVTLQGKLHLQVDSIPHTHEILKDQQNLDHSTIIPTLHLLILHIESLP